MDIKMDDLTHLKSTVFSWDWGDKGDWPLDPHITNLSFPSPFPSFHYHQNSICLSAVQNENGDRLSWNLPLNQAHKGIDAELWQMQDEICLLIISCMTKKWTRNQNWVSLVINLLSTQGKKQTRHLVWMCMKAVAQNIWLHATGGPHANLMHHRVLNCK